MDQKPVTLSDQNLEEATGGCRPITWSGDGLRIPARPLSAASIGSPSMAGANLNGVTTDSEATVLTEAEELNRLFRTCV